MAPPTDRKSRQRQLRLVNVLGIALIVAGLVVALFLHRVILPMRLAMGFIDVIAGATLLIFARQQARRDL
ncbi:hypothetical protein K0B96_10895 [Horticoccus luteus]|uniref:Uncharacterized protein n=1 Tax=Horticoccus luteus TaxID=2862869 RepID=A0A8F9XF87_9BACT|nr:hypothetical protein [Horticoccus luteus]QYM77827.1 hypothetical protein K0B96_10895 [Horticoccus luteus]